MDQHQEIDLLLITALTEEAQVVSAVLDLIATALPTVAATGSDTGRRLRLYDYPVEGGRVCRVAAASAHHMGAVGMGVFAAPLLDQLRPRSAALIGIAAAVDISAVELGDVPFASQVLSYDDIAIEQGVLTFRSDGFQVDPGMSAAVGELRTSIRSYRPWQEACVTLISEVVKILNQLRPTTMIPQKLARPPHLVVDVSAGGPFLLRDKDFRESLKKSPELPSLQGIKVAHPLHPKLVSAEMEAHGFMRAAHTCGVPASVLKGISDVGDAEKAKLEKETGGFFRAYACTNAVLAVLHILRSRSLTDPKMGRFASPPTVPRVPSQPGPGSAQADAARTSKAVSPLDGWTLVDEMFLVGQRRGLSADELNRYFDGAVPRWSHALSPEIARRDLVAVLIREFNEWRGNATGPLVKLLLGSIGEGKSTILLQVASDLAQQQEWRVLWRFDPENGLDADQIVQLERWSGSWLLVTDDADTLRDSLYDCLKALDRDDRSDIHILACAEDTAWWAKPQLWNRFSTFRRAELRGVSMEDALKVVRTWRKFPARDLIRTAHSSEDDHARAFFNAARQESGRQEGSFFGGLLRSRFSAPGLVEYVQEMMSRLGRHPLGRGSLLDAFVYVACCHAAAIPGLDMRVLADLVGVSHDSVKTVVEHPLGDEAASVRMRFALLTRHRAVAEAALGLLEGSFGVDLGETYARLVEQAIRTTSNVAEARGRPIFPHGQLVNCGPHLAKVLPDSIPKEKRGEVGVAAATAAFNTEPFRLGRVTGLAKAYRMADASEAAVDFCRSVKPDPEFHMDYADTIRGFFYEWSVVEGRIGNHINSITLAAISISDLLKPPVSLGQAELALAGIGVALIDLGDTQGDPRAARALRACSALGPLTRPNDTTARHFARYHRRADEMGAPSPGTPEEALVWLLEGIEATRGTADLDKLPAGLANALTFVGLARALGLRIGSGGVPGTRGAAGTAPTIRKPALVVGAEVKAKIAADPKKKGRPWATTPDGRSGRILDGGTPLGTAIGDDVLLVIHSVSGDTCNFCWPDAPQRPKVRV